MLATRSVSPSSPPVVAAYRYCEVVTGQQARNFAYGIRLLPPAKRRAVSALYAFSRRVDDVGDGPLPTEVKQRRLDENRVLLARLREGAIAEDDTDPVAVALHDATTRFPIPLDGLDELVDGVSMDVAGRRYGTWEELRDYCRCVAGAVGRLTLGVFGTPPGALGAEHAPHYADTLGLALQLTNILRDIREDAEHDRTYLPAEDLEKFGFPGGIPCFPPPSGRFPTGPGADADFAGLVRFEARRARSLFTEGLRLLPMLDRRSGACVAAMAGIYQRLLGRVEADPEAVLRGRVSLSAPEKIYVAARGLARTDARRVARADVP
ncbi:squalene synthase HpnD [Streptomyces sp. AJS327]|uniref:presqualene diphosphate synthase HpnD n=1 Tax=Streptomyces sp. AJS327 TaxID=2545265 RepID=UPI0015DF9575|nr:presqualene diphosphate synthase HpnD [Streptomyces sp. AJS327]MBA0052288.1 squalene synthase HpnD [Streptomyces sp. AJS327]